MAKLSDELVMIRRYATLMCMYSSLEPGSDEKKAAELALDEYETEILKRMGKVDVAGIARETSEPKWPSLDSESSDFTDGWNQAIEMCIEAFSDWSRSHLEGKSGQ